MEWSQSSLSTWRKNVSTLCSRKSFSRWKNWKRDGIEHFFPGIRTQADAAACQDTLHSLLQTQLWAPLQTALAMWFSPEEIKELLMAVWRLCHHKWKKVRSIPSKSFWDLVGWIGKETLIPCCAKHNNLQHKAKMSSGVWQHRSDKPHCHSFFWWLLQSNSEGEKPQLSPVLHSATLEQNNIPSQIDSGQLAGVSSSEAGTTLTY